MEAVLITFNFSNRKNQCQMGKYGTFKVDEESIKPIQNSKQFIDFIKWAERCGEDAFYIFDNPKDAVSRFLNVC